MHLPDSVMNAATSAGHAMSVSPAARPLEGTIAPPGSKSITNRALLLAALAKGTSHLQGILRSDDTARMIESLSKMGVQILDAGETALVIHAPARLRAPPEPLFVGNAGTAMRFLTAAAVLAEGTVVLDGDEHMRRRPIGALMTALRRLGAQIDDAGGVPPVTVRGLGTLSGRATEIDAGLSSQFASALLMLAPCGTTPIEVSLRSKAIGARGYIDLTLAAMAHFGARVEQTGEATWRAEPTGYHPAHFVVEPDASACTYLWAAAALTGGNIRIGHDPAQLTQPDARAHALIASFPDLPPVIEGSQMQDAIPTLAVMAAFNRHPVRFTGIANLRVKECDRIEALATELCRISPGLAHEEGDDLVVTPERLVSGGGRRIQIETYADHRIAMSFALAGLRVPGIEILDPGCVAKTYPAFWRDLASVGAKCTTVNRLE